MKGYKAYTKEKGLIETNDDRELIDLTWHREDGPAIISYYHNGNIEYEGYKIDDKGHRLNGPADICYDINGNITYVEYCINGIAYTKEQYEKELLKLKVQLL